MKVFLLFSYLKQKLRSSNENKINFNPSRRDKIYSENHGKNKKQENSYTTFIVIERSKDEILFS